MDDPISARYEWNAEGLVDALDVHRRLAGGTVGRLILRAFLAIFAVVTIVMPLGVVLASGGFEAKRGLLTVWAVVFGYCWGVFYLALWSKAIKRRQARRAFRDLPDGDRFVAWTFDEHQIANRTALSTSTFLWPVFIKAVESPKGFMLYQSRNFFRWIPAHGFASEGELHRFADLVRTKVPNYVVLGECQFPAKPEPIGLDEL